MEPSAPAALRRLQIALGVLATIERIETDQEQRFLEQIGEHVERLWANLNGQRTLRYASGSSGGWQQ